MARFKVINPVSVTYLALTGFVLCFMVSLAVVGASVSRLGEVLRYWFAPFSVNLSHAFGFQSDDFIRRLLLVAGVAGAAGYIVRGSGRRPVVRVAASIVGVVGVIDWFVLVVFAYLAMHLH